jgi:hypothetical protein
MYNGCQLFSPTLIVKVGGAYLNSDLLYAFVRVQSRGKREKHTHSLARR